MSTEQANFNRLLFKTKMYVTITLWKKCVLELGWWGEYVGHLIHQYIYMYDLIFFLLLVTIGAFNQKFYIYIFKMKTALISRGKEKSFEINTSSINRCCWMTKTILKHCMNFASLKKCVRKKKYSLHILCRNHSREIVTFIFYWYITNLAWERFSGKGTFPN